MNTGSISQGLMYYCSPRKKRLTLEAYTCAWLHMNETTDRYHEIALSC